MLDAIFRLLFNYRPVVFQQGDFRLAPDHRFVHRRRRSSSPPSRSTILTYRRTRDGATRGTALVLTGIRLATLLLVLFCLFRPVLVVKAAVPQQNFLGVLVDDSRSMQIADVDGQPRSAFVDAALRRRPRPTS